MRTSGVVAVALLIAIGSALPARAFQQPGVAVSGYLVGGCNILAFTLSQPMLWLWPDAYRVTDSDIAAIAPLDGLHVLGLSPRTYPNRVRILRLAADGSEGLFFDGLPGYWPSAIAAANSGRVFVTVRQTGSSGVAVLSSVGALEAVYSVDAGSELAVADDGCTIFFTRSGGIGRMDGCRGVLLPNFLTTSEEVNDVQALPDGSVLVAFSDSVALYDASGAYLRRIVSLSDLGLTGFAPQEVAISSDGLTLWIGASDICGAGWLLRVSISDGHELSRQRLSFNNITGIAAGVQDPAAIPAFDPPALALLAFALATAGVLIVRAR